MEECKNCKSTETVKNGLVRQKQRYKCKSCGHNFVCGDERRKKSTELKRITSVLLYSLGKASFRFLAKLFMFLQPRPITGCVRPNCRLGCQWS